MDLQRPSAHAHTAAAGSLPLPGGKVTVAHAQFLPASGFRAEEEVREGRARARSLKAGENLRGGWECAGKDCRVLGGPNPEARTK